MDKLRECPFCSGEANTTVFRGITGFLCDNCGGIISFRHKGEHGQAISAWNARAEQPNEPLTLDELKQIDGEPVWVALWNNKAYQNKCKLEEKFETHCFIRFATTHFEIRTPQGNRIDRYKSDYGKSWLAYRQKPKEDD